MKRCVYKDGKLVKVIVKEHCLLCTCNNYHIPFYSYIISVSPLGQKMLYIGKDYIIYYNYLHKRQCLATIIFTNLPSFSFHTCSTNFFKRTSDSLRYTSIIIHKHLTTFESRAIDINPKWLSCRNTVSKELWPDLHSCVTPWLSGVYQYALLPGVRITIRQDLVYISKEA